MFLSQPLTQGPCIRCVVSGLRWDSINHKISGNLVMIAIVALCVLFPAFNSRVFLDQSTPRSTPHPHVSCLASNYFVDPTPFVYSPARNCNTGSSRAAFVTINPALSQRRVSLCANGTAHYCVVHRLPLRHRWSPRLAASADDGDFVATADSSTYNAALIPFHHTPAGYNSHVPCCPRFGLLDAPTHPTPNTTPSHTPHVLPTPPRRPTVDNWFSSPPTASVSRQSTILFAVRRPSRRAPHPRLARRRAHRLLPHNSLASSAFTCTRRIPFSAPTFPPPPTCASSSPLKNAAEDWSLMYASPPYFIMVADVIDLELTDLSSDGTIIFYMCPSIYPTTFM
ncbi:hypothetical protein B0H13DRAFT_2328609 [Mycena leptocephala]|nr:hypothetical protein B0H13DRAFT_2328609 [Mycena leptocephala]